METKEHATKNLEQRLLVLLTAVRSGTDINLIPAAIEEEARINGESCTDYGATREARIRMKRLMVSHLSVIRSGHNLALSHAAIGREKELIAEIAKIEKTAEPIAATPPHND